MTSRGGSRGGGAEGARAPPWTHTFHNACTKLVVTQIVTQTAQLIS